MAKLVIDLMIDERDSKEKIEQMIFDIATVINDNFIPFEKIEFDGRIVVDNNRYHGLN